jgi:hypothetical protein
VPQTRLRSSFIYLANAVTDLRGNSARLAAVLAPLLLLASLCLLPEVLNIQNRLASSFQSGAHSVSFEQVQMPYPSATPAPPESQPFPDWSIYVLRALGLLISVAAGLVVLCHLARIQQGARAPNLIGETIEVYRRAVMLAPAFAWVTILQVLAPGIAIAILEINLTTANPLLSVIISTARFGLLVFAGCVYLWLYFAQYALVFDGQHSFHALLYSRDLMRKRFFTVATRIIVFLAVWSGYNSWAVGAFIIVSVLLGPVVALTGFIWTTVILLNLLWLSVSFATTAFFIAAGVRLYQDLGAIQAEERTAQVATTAGPATASLSATGA